jgi:hypothetical protein
LCLSDQCCHIGQYIADWATFESHLLQKKLYLLLFILAIFWATFVCQLQSGKNSIWEENSDFFGLENDFFGLKNDILEKIY